MQIFNASNSMTDILMGGLNSNQNEEKKNETYFNASTTEYIGALVQFHGHIRGFMYTFVKISMH